MSGASGSGAITPATRNRRSPSQTAVSGRRSVIPRRCAATAPSTVTG